MLVGAVVRGGRSRHSVRREDSGIDVETIQIEAREQKPKAQTATDGSRTAESNAASEGHTPCPAACGGAEAMSDLGTTYGLLNFTPLQWEKVQEYFETHADTIVDAELGDMWVMLFPDQPARVCRLVAAEVYSDITREFGESNATYITLACFEVYLKGDAHSEIDRFVDNIVVLKDRPTTYKEWIWAVLEETGPVYKEVPWMIWARRTAAGVIFICILASVVVMMIESLPQFYDEPRGPLFIVETFCIFFFTLEICMRLVATVNYKRHFTSVLTWVDICAVLPYYLSLVDGESAANTLVILRVLRLCRLFRVIKLGAQFRGVQLLLCTVQKAGDALLLSSFLINLVAVTIFASLMYAFERDEASMVDGVWMRNNDSVYFDAGKELMFQSIPDSMWWAWVTLTTVGYGDAVPYTSGGRLVASLTMLCGFVLMAFPITLLSNSLQTTVAEIESRREHNKRKLALMKRRVSAAEAVHIGMSHTRYDDDRSVGMGSFKGFNTNLGKHGGDNPTHGGEAVAGESPKETPVQSAPHSSRCSTLLDVPQDCQVQVTESLQGVNDLVRRVGNLEAQLSTALVLLRDLSTRSLERDQRTNPLSSLAVPPEAVS